MKKYVIAGVFELVIVFNIVAMRTMALSLNTHYDRNCHEYTCTLYRLHRSTGCHEQLVTPIIDHDILGHFVFRILEDDAVVLIGPFPTSPHDNQLLLTTALQQARERKFTTLHTSPLHAGETPENAVKIFGQNGFIFDQRRMLYKMLKSS